MASEQIQNGGAFIGII